MSIKQQEWHKAVELLLTTDRSHYGAFEIGAGPVVMFRRRLPGLTAVAAVDEAGDQDAAEDDSEARSAHQLDPGIPRSVVEYRVTYSVTYQVPVLSLIIRDFDGKSVTDLDRVYELLVPETSRSQLRDHGPLGMLTFTNDDLGPPAWQLHPCRTQEAMEHLSNGESITPERYLALWLGMVGPSVGLVVPDLIRQKLQRALGVV